MIPAAFAYKWAAAWNSHNLDRILSHYRPDVVFRSVKAAALVGTGEINGYEALRHYWSQALQHQPDLHFTVQDVYEGHNMLVITYLNHRHVRAAETLRFDPEGLVVEASACHIPGESSVSG